jgi:lipopolysaccharide exporter
MGRLAETIQNRLPKGDFVRNVVTLMTGTTFAQALTIIITPVLTRIYIPGDFGILGVYTSIIGVLAVICCGRYELAIVLPEKDEDASNLILVSILWTLVSTVTTLLIIMVGGEWLAGILKSPAIITWLWLLPLNVFCIGFFQTLNYWNTRFKNYKRLATRQITQSSVTAGAQLGFGFLTNAGAGGLIAGQLIGLFAATSFLINKFRIEDYVKVKRSLSRLELRKVADLYKKYPIYSMLPSVVDSLTVALPVIFFTKYFDLGITGQYALGVRLLLLPGALIGAAVAQVYFQKIAEDYNQSGSIAATVEKTCKALLMIAVPFCLAIMLLGPWLFTFFFGSNWTTAGEFARILAPDIALRFVASPLSIVFGVINRQEISALWQMTALAVTAASLGISLTVYDAYHSIAFLMGSDLLIYALYLVLIFRVSGAEFKNVLRMVK